MKNKHFNLNGTITINYNNELLMGQLQYRLLNLIINDHLLNNTYSELNISKQRAVSIINTMNRIAPNQIVDIDKGKQETRFRLTDFGMMLLNSYAQKEFDLYMFLRKSDDYLNNNIINNMEKKQEAMSLMGVL